EWVSESDSTSSAKVEGQPSLTEQRVPAGAVDGISDNSTSPREVMSPVDLRAGVSLSRKDQAEESAKKVKELQKERIATLKEMRDAISKLFQSGHASFDAVLEARQLLLKAELDGAEKESDRITLYKNFVDESKKIENLAEARVKAGQATQAA